MFERAAADGSWVVLCHVGQDSDGDGKLEARLDAVGNYAGDRLERKLLLLSGEAHAIDDLLASSEDGRWFVVARNGRGELWHADGRAPIDLSASGADLRRDPGLRETHRTLAFDAKHLFYVRGSHAATEVVERELESGGERVLAAVSTPVVRLSVDSAGRYLLAEVPGPDANGNGRFDWPRRLETEPATCRTPLPRLLGVHPSADPLESLIIDRNNGSVQRAAQLATLFGEALILREADGALTLSERGRRHPLADKACAGRVLWSDPWHEQLLLGCALPKLRMRLGVELWRRGARTPLGIDVAALSQDEPTHPPGRLVPLYPGADTVLFDSEARALQRLRSGDLVLATFGKRALFRRGQAAWLFDAESGSQTELPQALVREGDLLRAGSLCFVSPILVDLASARVLGQTSRRPLALTPTGALLFAEKPESATSLAEAPLSWSVLGSSDAEPAATARSAP